MTQPTDAESHLYDRADKPMINDQQAAIANGSASHTIADTSETCDRSDLKTHLDAIGSDINLILAALRKHGLIAD